MADLGLTHVALGVRDPDASAEFYAAFADLRVVHRRASADASGVVLWLADGTRPFVIVLIGVADAPPALRGPLNHIGIALASRDEVDERLDRARAEGFEVTGPTDSGPPVGYWGVIEDLDGNALELAYGQDVEYAVTSADE